MRPHKLFILLACVAYVKGICIREYFAQSVIYDKAMNIDFYYTGINMPTVTACAEFCADRHFCRTAVYNAFTKTCAISYEYTLNCRYNPSRFKDFPVDEAKSHLIQIACIEKCNEKTKNSLPESAPQILTAEPFNKLPQTLKRVELITGTPIDLSTSVDYAKLARARDHGNIADTQEDGYVNRLIIENITGVLAAHDEVISRFMHGGSKICYREIPQKYLLGSAFERHDHKSIQECRCLCAATYNSGKLHICQSFQWYTNGVCVLNKGNHLGKYDLIKDKYSTYQYVDCDEQVLLDIAEKLCVKTESIASLKTESSTTSRPTKETFTLPVLERSPFDPITGKLIKDENKVNLKTTVSKIEVTSTTKKVNEEVPEIRTTTPAELPSTTVVDATETTTTTVSSTTVSTTTTTPTTENSLSTTTSTTSNDLIEASGEELREEDKENEKKNVESNSIINEIEKKTNIKNEKESLTSTTEVDPPLLSTSSPLVSDKCFEFIDGLMLSNVAGGLEHDVSLEECQCICANSLKSGRYSFECASATYYHNERDCVLNLEHRNANENIFNNQIDEYNITYIGITCDQEKAASEVVKPNHLYGCKAEKPVTTTVSSINREAGEYTDKCYREMPLYVLEGTAQQIETGVSIQQCKCLCTQAEHRYGEPCQSFQYYFESETCLLSKYNRFSNPESFNHVPSTQKRSYFELSCATDESQLKRYIATECQIDDALRNELIRESENEILIVDKTTTTTTEVYTTQAQESVSTDQPVSEISIETTRAPKINFDSNIGEIEKIDSSTEISRNAIRKVSSEVGDGEESIENLTEVVLNKEKTEDKLSSEKDENFVVKVADDSKAHQQTQETDDEAEEQKLKSHPPKEAGIATDTPLNLEDPTNDVPGKSSENEVESDEEEKDDDDKAKPQSKKEDEVDDTDETVQSEEEKDDGEEEETENSKKNAANSIKTEKTSTELVQTTSKSKPRKVKGETRKPNVKDKIATEASSKSKPDDVSITTINQTNRTKKPILKKNKVYINHRIPETEGLKESDFDYEPEIEMSAETEATTIQTTATVEKVHKNIILDDSIQLPQKNLKLMDLLKKAHGVKTKKFTEKLAKAKELEIPSTTSTILPETSTFITTTTAAYPSFNHCTYSALYQTAFQGRRLLKAVYVKTASDCFSACYALRCRSANLVSQGEINQCQLFKDSLIDYRRPDMIGFDGSSVYFDGIRCEA